MIKQYSSITSIIADYDAFFIDLWGVIHDGVEAYPGVNDCLDKMRQAGKKLIFLSNAPRRAYRAIEGLRKVGVPDGLYDHVVTSGEVTFEFMQSGSSGYGKHYYMIGPERDGGLFDGLDLKRVASPKDADFVIVTGFEDDNSTLEEKIPELEECLRYKLPLICANPDIVIVRISGVRALCAGAIAEKYEQMGGRIKQFGKPYNEVYQKCMSYVQGVPKSRIAAIGDNLDTDIKGANNFDIDSYLIAGGILGEELGIKHGQLPSPDKLQKVCDRAAVAPTGVLPEFVW